ncbi:EpsG family protein [Photobacterium phosphoreum]|nr:EpsG family protein [Photobacterium phosphoreum]
MSNKSPYIYFKYYIALLMLISMSVVSGFRYYSGDDYISYMNIHNYIINNQYNYIFEPFFYFLNKISNSFSISSFLITLITNICIFYAILKVSNNSILGLFLYVLSEFYLSQFNIIRQSLGNSLLILSFVLFYYKNNTSSIIAFILSVFSHYAMLITAPILFLINKIKLKFYLFCLIIIIVYIFSQIGLFDFVYKIIGVLSFDKFSAYSEIDYSSMKTIGMKFIFNFIVFFFSVVLIKSKYKDYNNKLIENLIKIIMFGFFLSAIGTSIPIIFRLSYVFLNFSYLYYPYILTSNILSKSNRIIFGCVLFTYEILKLVYNLNANIYGIFPYDFKI